MFDKTYEIKVRIGEETLAGLRRFQLALGLEIAEEAARIYLRNHLVDFSYIAVDAPAPSDLFQN
ncbi:hypothetical protein [Pelagibacterium lentulum]|uniref:Uncharacterized protein n=1 Tax=Pelagibacterium lentulum TaxID=2029865 RepID=A0A916RD73_9HYPH|nr:hypothetical protein [Pelagibacterium lentulum]GGA51410.1 hypothetical protein GCM10011499_21820 [Pelagibacterium lentulum]